VKPVSETPSVIAERLEENEIQVCSDVLLVCVQPVFFAVNYCSAFEMMSTASAALEICCVFVHTIST